MVLKTNLPEVQQNNEFGSSSLQVILVPIPMNFEACRESVLMRYFYLLLYYTTNQYDPMALPLLTQRT
jgi:hypothetical protein